MEIGSGSRNDVTERYDINDGEKTKNMDVFGSFENYYMLWIYLCGSRW